MSYIITTGKSYVAREYIGDYRARDYLRPVYHEYGRKRPLARDPLVFETAEAASRYLQSNSWVVLGAIRAYSPCACEIGEAIS